MKKKEESFKYRTRRSFENIPSGNSLDPGRISESRQSPLSLPRILFREAFVRCRATDRSTRLKAANSLVRTFCKPDINSKAILGDLTDWP